MKKLPFFIFCLLFLNFIILFSSSAKSLETVSFVEKTQTDRFSYDIAGVNNSNKYANRIAQFNYEFKTGTRLDELYPNKYDSDFESEIHEFTDLSFGPYGSNETYMSKLLNVKRVSSNPNYRINNSFIDGIELGKIRNRMIVIPKDCISFYFILRDTTNFMYYRIDILTGALYYAGMGVAPTLIDASFIATTGYKFLYFEVEPSYALIDFTHLITGRTFNESGHPISTKQQLHTAVTPYEEYKFYSFEILASLANLNDITQFVGIDMNYQMSYSQIVVPTSKLSLSDYTAIELYSFYLTEIENDFSQIKIEKVSSLQESYAECLYYGRYLRFRTNSYTISNTSVLRTQFNHELDHSFSFKYCIDLSNLDINNQTIFSINFSYHNLNFTIYRNVDRFIYNSTLYFENDSISSTEYNISLTNNVITILFEFKNKYFSVSIKDDLNIYAYNYFINDLFSNLDIYNASLSYIMMSEKSLSLESFTDSIVLLHNNSISFTDVVEILSTYFNFNEIIEIPPLDVPSVVNNTLGGGLLYLKYNYIYQMNIETKRNSILGSQFSSITENKENYYVLFDGNDLNNSIDINFLNNKNGGILFLYFHFSAPTNDLIEFEITTEYTFVVVYSDIQPSTNLLLSTALDFLVPISLIFVIIVGFKSNSDSKYLGFVGLYVALFVLYLIDYLNLIFLILAFVFTSISLYVIIKHESWSEDSI